MKILEPIFIITHDSQEIHKYEHYNFAEKELEAYDIDNYSAFDSKLKRLKLFKKDQYNRVGFKLLDDNMNEDEIRLFFAEEESCQKIPIQELLLNIQSREAYYKTNEKDKIIPFVLFYILIPLIIIGVLIFL